MLDCQQKRWSAAGRRYLATTRSHHLIANPMMLMAISFVLTAIPFAGAAGESLWATPSNIKFENMSAGDRIIPLGFSKNGVFSYLLQQNSCQKTPGAGQDVSWLAIDLVTDNILEQVAFEVELPDVSAEEVLQKYGKRIEDSNSKYEIVTADSHEIVLSTEIEIEKTVLVIQAVLVENVDGEDAVEPGYRKYDVLLMSGEQRRKKLAEIKSIYEPLRFWGYLKSPFEERIAILFLSDFRGCDAFPQMRVNVVGASLIRGFDVER